MRVPPTAFENSGDRVRATTEDNRILEGAALIIDERRVSPRPDFISDLVNARDAGDKLNDRELFDQIFGICGASLSATSRAAGGALHLLYTHDDQPHQLIRDPSLIHWLI
jgi:cytochrome P450